MTTDNQVFSIKDGEYKVMLAGRVLPHTWNSKGAALAGLKTEARRRGIHLLSRDCWCNPKVFGKNGELE